MPRQLHPRILCKVRETELSGFPRPHIKNTATSLAENIGDTKGPSEIIHKMEDKRERHHREKVCAHARVCACACEGGGGGKHLAMQCIVERSERGLCSSIPQTVERPQCTGCIN